MNAIRHPRRPGFFWWAPLLLIFFVAGCATRIDWSSRVGHYTYDDAVLELGPPDKQARLEDGTLVAEWLTRRGYTRTHSPIGYGYHGFYPYRYYGPIYPSYMETSSPDYFLRLVFGADNRLIDWRRYAR